MAGNKIQSTKNYRLFERHSSENRPFDISKHKKLLESMKLYGFLRCFPVVVSPKSNGTKIIKDGQHRFSIAESLGLPIHWIEAEVDFDVAVVNSTAKIWQLRDYAQKHAANGLKAYSEGIEFADTHSLPVGTAFALLAGNTGFTNIQRQFIDGTFRVKDRTWADAVAGVYGPLVLMAPALRNARFIEACMGVCRVKEFDPKRLILRAEGCRERLVAYSTRDAYLDMLEEVYNFRSKQLVGLKAAALMALKERDPTRKSSRVGKDKAA